MSTTQQMSDDDPCMIAWNAYKASDDYANTKRWAVNQENVDGSLWAAFLEGWNRRAPESSESAETAHNSDYAAAAEKVVREKLSTIFGEAVILDIVSSLNSALRNIA